MLERQAFAEFVLVFFWKFYGFHVWKKYFICMEASLLCAYDTVVAPLNEVMRKEKTFSYWKSPDG